MIGRETPPGIEHDGVFHRVPGGDGRDTEDHRGLRHPIDRYEGFRVGKYIQAVPMFFSRLGHNIFLEDTYRGAACFLILGGPSFAKIDKGLLCKPNVLTMGVNNSPASFRPNLWTEVDDPGNFLASIWLDPLIEKIVPLDHAEKNIFDSINWRELGMKVGDCPNVWFFRRNETFNAKQFLFEDSINWGGHTNLCACGHKRPDKKKGATKDEMKAWKLCPQCNRTDHWGGRSVMLAALRILFLLGVRTVFLLGCDFTMTPEVGYHFQQTRSKQAVKNNNNTYMLLAERFAELRPVFEKHEFNVFNCNKESGLKAFDFVAFPDALMFAQRNFPDPAKEKTEGLYERRAEEKKKAEQAAKAVAPAPAPAQGKSRGTFAEFVAARG